MIFTRWVPLARRLALLLGAYSLLRGLFLFHNRAIFADAHAGQIAGTFLYGLRFDLSAVAMINLPFVVLTFLPRQPHPSPAYQRLMKTLFLIVNFSFLAVNILHLEFFQFTGRRCDVNLLNLAGDAGVKWTTMGLYYWPL